MSNFMTFKTMEKSGLFQIRSEKLNINDNKAPSF